MKSRLTISVSVLLVALAMSLNSCSGIVDAPSSSSAVTNVSDFYFPLAKIGTSYSYARMTNYGTDTIHLTMRGSDPSASIVGSPQCFAADIQKKGYFANDLYFSVNDSEAFTAGSVSCGTPSSSWLDLKAPLLEGQEWTFNDGDVYSVTKMKATVLRRGLQMKMQDGTVFPDVTEIRYVSANADTTIKWFARNVGLVYTTSNRPDANFGDEMRLIGTDN